MPTADISPYAWLTPPPADGNPRKLTAWAFENAWNMSKIKSAEADAMFNKAIDAEGGPASMHAVPFGFVPNAVEPLVNIPMQAEGASLARFYELSTAVIRQLADEYRNFMVQYGLNDFGYLDEAKAWIHTALTTGGTGINPIVERQIWDRERSRITRELERAESETMQTWAGRGYPLPPGMLSNQILSLRKDANDKIAQASRDRAIKSFETEVENVRFAVESALKLFPAAMGAAGDFIKAIAVGPTSAMQVIPSITDSQSRLIGAATDVFRARISVEELKLKASMPAAEYEQQARTKNGDWLMAQIKLQVDAAVEAARNLGTQTAATLNSLHAATGATNSTQDSVSYNYSNDTVDAAPTVTQVV